MLEKVEKALIQTDEDLSTKLDLLPKFRPKQLTFGSEEPKPLPATSEDEKIKKKSIKTIINKGTGLNSKGLGTLSRKYLPFPDNKFCIWYDEEHFISATKVTKFWLMVTI
jgi:hypothetical protein